MWRLDQFGEPSRSFDTQAEADAVEAQIRREKNKPFVVVWDDGVTEEVA